MGCVLRGLGFDEYEVRISFYNGFFDGGGDEDEGRNSDWAWGLN